MGGAEFALLFAEGVLAFISPCFLPMIPVYLSFLAGQGDSPGRKVLVNALGFILGFTVVFVALGMSATLFAQVLIRHRILLQRIGGVLLILFGLNMTGLIRLVFLNRDTRFRLQLKQNRFFSSLLFGVIISFGWSPCLGAFLGAALLQAGNSQTFWLGGLKLFVFSIGLGIPFLVTALLFHNLTSVFEGLRRRSRGISLLSGIFLIAMGILMVLDRFIFYAAAFY